MSFVPTVVPAELAAVFGSDGGALAIGGAGLVLGAAGSLHCFLMCGPLACAAAAPGARAKSALVAYHGARLASYAWLGGLFGIFGAAFGRAFTLPLRSVMPWLLVAALLASAFDLGKRLAPIPGLASLARAAHRLSTALSPTTRAAVFGALTPLLPCGLLYGVFAAAFTAESFAGGALLLGSFALGAIPALVLAQLAGGLRGRLRGWPAIALSRGLPVAAAAVIAWRALVAASGAACH